MGINAESGLILWESQKNQGNEVRIRGKSAIYHWKSVILHWIVSYLDLCIAASLQIHQVQSKQLSFASHFLLKEALSSQPEAGSSSMRSLGTIKTGLVFNLY